MRKIVAVEPHPRCFRIMQNNLANRPESTTFVLVQKAVAHEAGPAKLFEHRGRKNKPARLFFSSLYRKRPMRDDYISVDGKPLQWYLDTYDPDVVKLDAEGVEVELRHCKDWRRVRTIVAEWDFKYHGLQQWARTKAALEKHGFQLTGKPAVPKQLPSPGKSSGMVFVASRVPTA